MVVLECEFCGKPFDVKPSHAGYRKHCSRECNAAAKSRDALGYDPKRRVEKHCEICGETIWVKKSHADVEGTYCSRECMAVGYSERLTGSENPNYRHGRSHTREWYREWAKEWRADNRDKITLYNRRRRARENEAKGDFTNAEFRRLCKKYDNKCLRCGRADVKLTPDHVVPLARGGGNGIDNIQPLCRRCNSSKKDKIKDYRKRGSIKRWIQRKLL